MGRPIRASHGSAAFAHSADHAPPTLRRALMVVKTYDRETVARLGIDCVFVQENHSLYVPA